MEKTEADASLIEQLEGWQQMSAFAGSMVLKCAVELRIADIIHSHGGPTTLSQIASDITSSSCPDMSYLERIMRLLVLKNIFTAHRPSDGGETLYDLTHLSRWILWDSKPSLVPFILLENYHSQCVKDDEDGGDIWDFALTNPDFNNSFDDDAMSTTTTVDILIDVFLPAYKDELESVGSVVDIGGGSGRTMHEVVKSHPHIKAINFDLPHVIATAPNFQGVSHIGGDMFENIPSADAVLLKGILHDWSHEECVKILQNCHNAIPEKNGKVIIVDIVLEQEDNNIPEESQITSELKTMVLTNRKERTEVEWKKLLKEGGFPQHRIIKFPAKQCIIVAYPI
ncbi:xanthohumol 4-O-methyltransferase-like [Ziziphus jujuba]|uniref:Xanthohumol 4-O-methyltransferase-like n=1 Tax=Ziziphus jujuba TaxID=326968 RepID=A0A6P3ZN90_ZIZJJ|nr:xanthohumol 4-O-methyltransferase-like [Ziziphus jujuba]